MRGWVHVLKTVSIVRTDVCTLSVITAFIFLGALLSTVQPKEFPIDQFKGFVSRRPTIEECDFQVLTARYGIRGLKQGTYRPFSIVFEDETKYRLIEDRRGYWITADVPISGAPTQTKRQEFETPYKEFCWTRFENKFWSTVQS